MRKPIFVSCILLLILMTATSCHSLFHQGGESDVISNNDFIKTIPVPSWENKEEKTVAEAWKTRAEKILQSDKISKVEYIQYFDGVPYQVFSSQDTLLINRWKTLLPQFRCSVIPFEFYFGGAATLTFYEEEVPLSLWVDHQALSIFMIEEGKTDFMLRIDNYDEVKDELSAILTAMGLPDPNAVVSSWE